MTSFNYFSLAGANIVERLIVVVIEVLRAFTAAAFCQLPLPSSAAHVRFSPSFVINGTHKNRDGDGDRACAAYLAALIRGEQSSPEIYLNRVGASTVGRDFRFGDVKYILQQDSDLSIDLDHFDIARPVRSQEGRLDLEKVDV